MNTLVSDTSIVQAISDLPPMPQVASRVLTLADDPNCGNELVSLLSRDGALAANILRLANSVVFCRREKIGDLEQAVFTIGLNALKGMVLATQFDKLLGSREPIKELIWETSVGTAISAVTLARCLDRPQLDEAFLLGLLHNLGQVVLIASPYTADRYGAVLELIKERSVDFATAEEAVFGFSYPRAGALLARRWNFPNAMCETILHHYNITESPRSALEQDWTLVKLAALTCHASGIGNPEGYPLDPGLVFSVANRLSFKSSSTSRELASAQVTVRTLFAQERHLYRSADA